MKLGRLLVRVQSAKKFTQIKTFVRFPDVIVDAIFAPNLEMHTLQSPARRARRAFV